MTAAVSRHPLRARAKGVFVWALAALVIAGCATPDAGAPARIATGSLGAGTAGSLVEIAGRVVRGPEDDRPWGWKLWLDDGSGPALVFIAPDTGIDVASLRTGQRLAATGLAARYEQHYEVLPRRRSDIRAVPD